MILHTRLYNWRKLYREHYHLNTNHSRVEAFLTFWHPNHTIFYRTPKIDEWFHAAAVWKRDQRKTYLYLNGQEIGRSDKSNTIPKNFPTTTCDIGLKRGSNDTTRGYLKNLMIVGAALTSEEIINMTGRATFFNFSNSHDNSSLGTPR